MKTTPSASGAFVSTIAEPGRAAAFFGQARHRGVFFQLAHAIGQLEFVADVGEAFEFAGAGGGNHHLFARRDAGAGFGDEGGDVAVIARGGLGLQGAQFVRGRSVLRAAKLVG